MKSKSALCDKWRFPIRKWVSLRHKNCHILLIVFTILRTKNYAEVTEHMGARVLVSCIYIGGDNELMGGSTKCLRLHKWLVLNPLWSNFRLSLVLSHLRATHSRGILAMEQYKVINKKEFKYFFVIPGCLQATSMKWIITSGWLQEDVIIVFWRWKI